MTAMKKDGEVVAVSVKELGYIVKYVAAATKQGASLNNLLQELREWGQSTNPNQGARKCNTNTI